MDLQTEEDSGIESEEEQTKICHVQFDDEDDSDDKEGDQDDDDEGAPDNIDNEGDPNPAPAPVLCQLQPLLHHWEVLTSLQLT